MARLHRCRASTSATDPHSAGTSFGAASRSSERAQQPPLRPFLLVYWVTSPGDVLRTLLTDFLPTLVQNEILEPGMPKIAEYTYSREEAVDRVFSGISYRVAIARHDDATHYEVVVFDRRNGLVVVDGIGAGNHAIQQAVFKRLKAVDYAEFALICRCSPGFRPDNAPAMSRGAPTAHGGSNLRVISRDGGIRQHAARDIRLPQSREAGERAAGINASSHRFTYPHRTRQEIVSWLARHRTVAASGELRRLSWDAGIPEHDGRGYLEDFSPDPAFDAGWLEMLREGLVVRQAWVEAMQTFSAGTFTPTPGEHLGRFEFDIRPDSEMVMRSINGVDVAFRSASDMQEQLMAASDRALALLYHVVGAVDEIMHPDAARDELEYRLASIRAELEEGMSPEPDLVGPSL